MKKIFILLSIVSLISVSIFIYFLSINRNKNEFIVKDENKNGIIESNNSIEEEEEILDENITESIKDNVSGAEDNVYSIHNSNKNDLEINSASNTNVVKENKTKEKKTSSQTVSKSEPESKQEVNETNNENNTSVNKEEPKKQKPWEAFGVSEYHYYNEPIYSWEKVDFPVSKYGSEANCRKACADKKDFDIKYNKETNHRTHMTVTLNRRLKQVERSILPHKIKAEQYHIEIIEKEEKIIINIYNEKNDLELNMR